MGQGYGHRHISHMLGLYPGDLIAQSDEWLAAAKVSMQNRTDETTGWAMAQRVATWARDLQKAIKHTTYCPKWSRAARSDKPVGYTRSVPDRRKLRLHSGSCGNACSEQHGSHRPDACSSESMGNR